MGVSLRLSGGPVPPAEEQATSRQTRGWFSSRLSNKSKGGRHRTFRGVSDFFRLAVESLNEYALITMDKDRVISSWSGPAAASSRDFLKKTPEIVRAECSLRRLVKAAGDKAGPPPA